MMHRHSCRACCIDGSMVCVAAGQPPEKEESPFFACNQLVSSSTYSLPLVAAATAMQDPHHLQQLIYLWNPPEEEEEEEAPPHFVPQPQLRSLRIHGSPPLHLMTASQHQRNSDSHCMSRISYPSTSSMACYGCMHSNSMIFESSCCSDHRPLAYPCSHVHYTCHLCSAHANALRPQCCQIATHGGDAQEGPCFVAPMPPVDVSEHTCAFMGSASVDGQYRSGMNKNSVDDASDHVLQSGMVSQDENVQAHMAAPNDLPMDLIAHTRELHSVWWGGGISIHASPKHLYKGALSHDTEGWVSENQDEQEKHSEEKGFLELEGGAEQGAKPSSDGSFRKEAQKERQNCWNKQSKNKKRRRYFPRQRHDNAITWDGPRTSNVCTTSEKPSRFKDADGWGDGNIAFNENACCDQVNGSTKGTARESAHLYQIWEENLGLRSKEDFYTTACPSSYVGWTDSYVEHPKVCNEPGSADPKENEQGMQFKQASPNARTKDSAETPPSNIESTWLGRKGMDMHEGGHTVVMPGGDIGPSCRLEGTSTWEECGEKLHTNRIRVSDLTTEGRKESALVLNKTMDFLSSSSDDRDYEDCLLYEPDDGHYPVAGMDSDAKSQENWAYEFFMQVFEENEELKKRYKEEYGVGEFDCLVCSNIPNKPIKRYNGLMSVVMHAKKILNTKRLHDHRGFARAVCDFMGWDAHGNPRVRPLENTEPRACLLESERIPEGDEKISSDSEVELVGGRDSVRHILREDNTVLENNVEDMMVADGESLFLKVNICEDTMEEVARPAEDNPAMQQKTDNIDGANKEDNVVLEEGVALKTNTCQDGVLENNACQGAIRISIIINDEGNDGARICLERKVCQNEGSSDQACVHLEGAGIAMEETVGNDSTSQGSDTHVLGEIGSSLYDAEAGQDVAKVFREQLLDKTFGLDSKVQEICKSHEERGSPELGGFKHGCEEEGEEGGKVVSSCEGDEAVEGEGTSKMVVPCDDKGIEAEEAMTG